MNIAKLIKNNMRHKPSKIMVTCLIFVSLVFIIHSGNYIYENTDKLTENVKCSGLWATLDLNPSSINNSRLRTGSPLSIQGRLYNRINNSGKPGYTVAIEVDNVVDMSFQDVTDMNGYFLITYVVDSSLNIYSSHLIEAIVVDSTPGDVEYRTYYNIFVNTSSFFEIYDPVDTKLTGEQLSFEGYLRYENGTGIPNTGLNYYWFDGGMFVTGSTIWTDHLGEIGDIPIPDIPSSSLTINFSFFMFPFIDYSEAELINTRIFSDINCIWNLPDPIYEDRTLHILGQIVSSTDPALEINNRQIRINYNGTFTTTVTTDGSGHFSYDHDLPPGIGPAGIRVRILNSLGKNITATHFFTVIEAPYVPPPPTPPAIPPYIMFLSIFIPIIAGVVVVLGFIAYKRYKKQDKESRVVKLPLEDRLLNLKLLKESGRLEECLSYLFNSIYMELVNAKFGRTRNENETIRDFAIVSVKDLKLNPTTIYPFIQKVEEIIYARPFQISDKDFYYTVELFSPVYHQLTGYDFSLNF